jgi:hypothetical protein
MTEGITKLMFQKQHWDAIAELIGEKIVYGFMDEKDYSIIKHSQRDVCTRQPGNI